MKRVARYYMVGGFLGAGKTTAVAALAQHLTERGERVGLITNDQGSELVDTAMLRARGFTTEEIPGGCFCCRFNSLVEAAKKLTDAAMPDAFVAEPVGSCTDLVATVSYPLRRIYGNRFDLAPLSVLVDPIRAEQVMGLGQRRSFSDKVLYIWRKQVEEADIIVVAKSDLLDAAQLTRLRHELAAQFPNKPLVNVSVRTGAGVMAWFALLDEVAPGTGAAMQLDYDVYAEGEALLGWLNATVAIESGQPLDASELLQWFAVEMQRHLAHAEIAHLKMTFSPKDALAGEIAAISLVRNDFVPELSLRLDEPALSGQLIVNCRAEADPAELRAVLEKSLAALPRQFPQLQTKLDHVEHFRPGRPQPTHRLERPDPIGAS